MEEHFTYDHLNRRNPETWQASSQLPAPMFDRGFTGQEHLNAFGLINMNGRMYDPQMSSFLSVDAYVQSPDNSQSFNRYAYCLNNPLKYTDPTGWQMVGGTTPSNPFHDNWGVNFAEHVVTSHEAREILWNMGISIGTWMVGNVLTGGGGESMETKGGWYRDSNGTIQWSPVISSIKEFRQSGIDGDYLGHTFVDKENQIYYSLLGYKIDMSLNNGLSGVLMPLIDNCFEKYENDQNYTPKDPFDVFNPERSTTNLGVINYNPNGDNLHSFESNRMTVYLIVSDASSGLKENSMFSSFCGLSTCERYNTNAHYHLSNHTTLKPGYDLFFNNPVANQNCWRVMIVFPTTTVRDDFKQRYYQVFGYGNH